MDDPSLVDIYEDLSLDASAKVELEEEDHRIDLFTEALAINSVNKVHVQLSKLKKENEKLRQENAELRESSQQLSKNISSLYLTARREIQKKEQEIAKLVLDRQQGNCEQCKVIPNRPAEALITKGKFVSKQPTDICLPSLIRSVASPREEKTPSEVRDRLKQEISQSYSLSSCQGVASRKKTAQPLSQEVHKQSSITSETHRPLSKEVKLQNKSSNKDREVTDSKQDNSSRSKTQTVSRSSGHREPRVSHIDITTAVKGCKLVAQKNKLNMSEVDAHQCVKIRKTEANQNDVIHNFLIEKSKSIDTAEHKTDWVEHHSEPDSFSVSENKTSNFVMKSSTCTNSKLNIDGHPDRAKISKNVTIVKESDKEVGNRLRSLNRNHSAVESKSAAFISAETCKNYSARDVQYNEKYIKIKGIPELNIPEADGSVEGSAEKFDRNDSASSTAKLEEINHLEFGNNKMPYKSVNNKEPLAVTSNENVNNISHLRGSSSEIPRKDKQALYGQKKSEHCTRRTSSSKEFRKLIDESKDSDQNSNCNKSVSTFYDEKLCHSNSRQESNTDFSCQVKAEGDTLEYTDSYITCTSNLILLGDEETTCMTIVSPSKLQPSEFYPPGVRGDVHEGGSHVRHIRGVTEVIKKLPLSLNGFQNDVDNTHKPNSTVVGGVQTKTVTNVSITPTNIGLSDLSDSNKTFKLQNMLENDRHNSSAKEHMRSSCKAPQVKLKSQVYNNLEKESSAEHNRTSSVVREVTGGSLFGCDAGQSWVSTVSDMFGHIFQKKLHTLKQGTDYQIQSEAEFMKR